MQDINKQIGKRIHFLRQAKRISQEELADSSGIHRAHLGEIERGESHVTVATLQRIGLALQVSMPSLMKGVGGSQREG
jgi:transcriptional regulator with XRE-family HTH domain